LSQELRTAGLLRPHVLIGYRWSHIGLCPGGNPVITGSSAASCHNPLRTARAPFRRMQLKHGTTSLRDTTGSVPPPHDTPYGTRPTPSDLGPAWTLLRQCRLPRWLRWRGPHQRGSLRSRRQICFAPYAGCLTVHGRPHPREVGPLSRGVMSPSAQLLSGPLQVGVRFLPRPLPAAPSTRLTAHLPSREGYGLTTLRRGNMRGLGPASTPVARHLRRAS